MPAATARNDAPRSRRKTRKPAVAARRSKFSFAEGMRPFVGMVKTAPPDLSTREAFGRKVSD